MTVAAALPSIELPLPPAQIRFMAESDEQFVAIGDECLADLRAEGLREESALLDIGCGYGRLASALVRWSEFRGSYDGFDVLQRQVAWCREELGSRSPLLRFRHLDIFNERYNKTGSLVPGRFAFPYADRSFDAAALFSIFTHFFEADIQHYLGEIARVLRPGGFCNATFFLNTPERAALIADPACPMRMAHRLNDHTWYKDPADKLHAICHDLSHVERWIEAAGMEVRRVRFGNWTGRSGDGYQDTIVMTVR